jgi:hypothetical protein
MTINGISQIEGFRSRGVWSRSPSQGIYNNIIIIMFIRTQGTYNETKNASKKSNSSASQHVHK